MKITHEAIREEIEAWAMRVGQRAVAIKITESAFQSGICDVLQPIYTPAGGADNAAIYNNRQQIFRWLRSNHHNAVERVSRLWPAIEISLPGERRARLMGENFTYLFTVAIRECSEAVNAAALNDPNFEKEREEAINSLLALRPNRPQLSSI